MVVILGNTEYVTPAFKMKSKTLFYAFATKFRLSLTKSHPNINVDFAKDL